MTQEEFDAAFDEYCENRTSQYTNNPPTQKQVEMPVNESVARYSTNYKGAMAITPSAPKNKKKGK